MITLRRRHDALVLGAYYGLANSLAFFRIVTGVGVQAEAFVH